MTAEEIRAIRMGSGGSVNPNLHEAQFVFLREIAAQLAEHNSYSLESLELTKKEHRRMFGDDKPTLAPGTVVKIMTVREIGEEQYGQVCALCRMIHPIPEEEALRIAAEVAQQRSQRPQ
jgi:hypothetical protein